MKRKDRLTLHFIDLIQDMEDPLLEYFERIIDENYTFLKMIETIEQSTTQEDSEVTDNISKHKDLLDEIHATYKEKNHKYGDSFVETVNKYGLIASITRMHDKFNRIQNIVLKEVDDDEDERLVDSLKDLANYCLMTVMVIEDV